MTESMRAQENIDGASVIAEVGVNHNGDVELAIEMITAAHEAGADYVKLQSFVMEEFFSPELEYYAETESFALSPAEQERLFSFAKESGIALITTPFDYKSLDFLDRFDLPAYKVASMDCDNYPLIRAVAEKGKRIFLSTGMAEIGEIEKALETVFSAGNSDVVLLHCVSAYPTPPAEINLSFMLKLMRVFDIPVGLSDHSIGLQSAFMAASLGVVAIEKHFTTDRRYAETYPGADHDISLLPEDLRQLVQFCRQVPVIMGSDRRLFSQSEQNGRIGMRRSWYARKRIEPGETFTPENIVALRPVSGVPAGMSDLVIGKKACRVVKGGQPIHFQDIGE